MTTLPTPDSRREGGYFSAPAVTFETISAPKDYTTSPVTANGETYRFARGIIADADGTVDLRPVGDTVSHTITVKAGVVVPVYFEAVSGLIGPTAVTVLF